MQGCPKDRDRVAERLLRFWYPCLGPAFALLGLRNLLAGAPAWALVLRSSVAVGFLVLGR